MGEVAKMGTPLAGPLAGKPGASQDELRLRVEEKQRLSATRKRTGSCLRSTASGAAALCPG